MSVFTKFFKNKKNISKIRRAKVTDYAALTPPKFLVLVFDSLQNLISVKRKQAYNLHVTFLFFFIFVQYYTKCMCLLSLVSNLQLYELKNNPQVYTIQYGIGVNVFLLIHRRYTTCDIINWYMYYFILFIDDQYFFSS